MTFRVLLMALGVTALAGCNDWHEVTHDSQPAYFADADSPILRVDGGGHTFVTCPRGYHLGPRFWFVGQEARRCIVNPPPAQSQD